MSKRSEVSPQVWDGPPLPPVELRRLVCHDDSPFQLKRDGLIFPYVAADLYKRVFDFGCGCGRIARQLLIQDPRPEHYVGIDIHAGMIDWCKANLSPIDRDFEFHHHDVWNLGLGPNNTRQLTAPFPADDRSHSLVVAHSIFTHLYKEQTVHYLAEIARILTANGVARTTWFLFDRSTFPMLFDFQVCLFVNEIDPTNAVIYDWRWLLNTINEHKLKITYTIPPAQRGFQWELYLQHFDTETPEHFPSDDLATMERLCGSGVQIERSTGRVIITSPGTTTGPPITKAEVLDCKDQGTRTRVPLRFTGRATGNEFDRRCQAVDWWYHSFYFDNGLAVRGDYDIGADVAAYGFPESLKGLRVLDVGTGAGWFAFYFEQQGAEVTAVDARGYCDFDVYGRHYQPPVESEKATPDKIDDEGRPLYFSPMSKGFWVMKGLLESQVRYQNARVYDLCPEVFDGQKFDLVFLGCLLCHLRDPIGALMAVRSVCRHRVIAATTIVVGEPISEVQPRQYLPHTAADRISWWLPNEACFRHWFLAAGFTGVDIDRQVLLRSDLAHFEGGRFINADQILRVGSAFIP